MLSSPSAFALCNDFGGKQGDGFALGAVDIMEQAAVVTGIDGMPEKAADHDGKDEMQHMWELNQ